MSYKPMLVLDFDGVIHSYTSGWEAANIVRDPPVDGAMDFIERAVEVFEVAIFSSRSLQPGGMEAMLHWLQNHLDNDEVFEKLKWPTEKPPARVTLDDRAITFTGEWPELEDLLAFKPWNKQ